MITEDDAGRMLEMVRDVAALSEWQINKILEIWYHNDLIGERNDYRK